MKSLDLLGMRFGRLTVISRSDLRTTGKIHWLCRCDCGKECAVSRGNLTMGRTKSCGCQKAEMSAKRRFKHGMAGTSEQRIWKLIKDRCLNVNSPSYPYYGARGITICAEWKDDFMAFYRHVGPRPSLGHSIERIDNSRGYEPGNVCWATRHTQARNRRDNKLSLMAVRVARRLKEHGIGAREFAGIIGANPTTVFRALSGQTWARSA